MAIIVRLFSVGDDVWVVNPAIPALYNGTVVSISMVEYLDGTGTLLTKIAYTILLNDGTGTITQPEEYVKATQIEGLTLLATLIDSVSCA